MDDWKLSSWAWVTGDHRDRLDANLTGLQVSSFTRKFLMQKILTSFRNIGIFSVDKEHGVSSEKAWALQGNRFKSEEMDVKKLTSVRIGDDRYKFHFKKLASKKNPVIAN